MFIKYTEDTKLQTLESMIKIPKRGTVFRSRKKSYDAI